MQRKDSLPCEQETTIDLQPKQKNTGPNFLPCNTKINLKVALPFTPTSYPSSFLNKTGHESLTNFMPSACPTHHHP